MKEAMEKMVFSQKRMQRAEAELVAARQHYAIVCGKFMDEFAVSEKDDLLHYVINLDGSGSYLISIKDNWHEYDFPYKAITILPVHSI